MFVYLVRRKAKRKVVATYLSRSEGPVPQPPRASKMVRVALQTDLTDRL